MWYHQISIEFQLKLFQSLNFKHGIPNEIAFEIQTSLSSSPKLQAQNFESNARFIANFVEMFISAI